MTNEEQDRVLLAKLDESRNPLTLSELPGEERQKDRRLQVLKRQGKVKYLVKATGGPGWVLTCVLTYEDLDAPGGSSSLSEDDVLMIRHLWEASEMSTTDIGLRYDRSASAIKAIVERRTYSGVR